MNLFLLVTLPRCLALLRQSMLCDQAPGRERVFQPVGFTPRACLLFLSVVVGTAALYAQNQPSAAKSPAQSPQIDLLSLIPVLSNELRIEHVACDAHNR